MPDAQMTISRWPPLPMTTARLRARSRFSMLRARISLVRAAVSYSIRHRVFSRSLMWGRGPEGFKIVVGDGFGLVVGYAFAVDGCHRVVVCEPFVAATVAYEGLESSDPGVPCGGCGLAPTLVEHPTDAGTCKLVDGQVCAEVSGESIERLAVGSVTVRGEVFVGEERLYRAAEGW